MALTCLYCGNPVQHVNKGEHIFQRALGGIRTIPNVCSTCNNSVLSPLDDELVSKSQLGIVASEILGKQLFHCWDVDHYANDLLMEAEPIFQAGSIHNFRLWPQLILEGENLQFLADLDEAKAYGFEHAFRHMFAQARRSYMSWNRSTDRKSQKALMFQRIPARQVLWQSNRFPPRIFAKRRFNAFTREMSMIVRYVTDEDKRRLLHRLGKITADLNPRDEHVFYLNERLAQISQEWQPELIVRALTKLGINLLSHLCTKTKVDLTTFPDPIAFVTGKLQLSIDTYMKWGFVWPNDLSEIHRTDKGHAARLVYDDNNKIWNVYISFFGGRMAAFVQIPGPNQEEWMTSTVSTPLSSKVRDVTHEWEETHSSLFMPIRVHVDWDDATRTDRGIHNLKCFPNIYQRLPTRIVERNSNSKRAIS